MKAVSVNEDRKLEVREVPTPSQIPAGHVLIEIEAAAVNHGDKAFLAMPRAAAGFSTSKHDIWGASAAGRVLSAGAEVPSEYVGSKVAIYRSLTPSPEIVGLWAEQAVVSWTDCLILPEELSAADYSGSLVNAITGYAFLEMAISEGHGGIVATVGGAATALALSVLATRRNIPVLHLVRSERSAKELQVLGIKHILVTDDSDFDSKFETLAESLKATAVFDGAGGELVGRIAPHLPRNSTVWFYGFLNGTAPVAIPSITFMQKNLTMKPFSNFNTPTVQDRATLQQALADLRTVIANPLFRTRAGKPFPFEQIQEAMAYENKPGSKAVLVPAG